MPQLAKLLLSLAAGIILPLAFAPYSLWLLSYLSLIVLLYVIDHSQPKAAFCYGLAYGVAALSLGASWAFRGFHAYTHRPWSMITLAMILFVVFFALFSALWTYSYRKFFRSTPSNTLLAFPILGVFWEYLRSTIFPWLMYGTSQIDSPLRSLAPIFGVYGVSLAVLMISAALYLYSQKIKVLNTSALAIILLITLLTSNLNFIEQGKQKYSVALIQTNLSSYQKLDFTLDFSQVWDKYAQDILQNLDKDLIIFPEYSLPHSLAEASDFINFLNDFGQEHHVTIIFGIGKHTPDKMNLYNGLIVSGASHDEYYKHILVPFGEYIPLPKIVKPIFRLLGVPFQHTLPSDSPQLITIKDIKIIPAICFEAAFTDFIRQAIVQYASHVIVNISEDCWFKDSWGSLQHFEITRMRALENGAYLLRATTTGITALVDYHGVTLAQIPQFTHGVVSGEFYQLHGQTPWSRLGRWPLFTVLLTILLLLKVREPIQGVNYVPDSP